jgi:hypothetical protein
MPLTRHREAYSSNKFNAVVFWMQDGADSARTLLAKVSYEALSDRAQADGDGLSAGQTFDRHRHRIEKIASDKYDAGDFAAGDRDGAEIIVRSQELNE